MIAVQYHCDYVFFVQNYILVRGHYSAKWFLCRVTAIATTCESNDDASIFVYCIGHL